MKGTPKRLKKKVDLGLGVLPIKLISKKLMREICDCDPDDVTPDGCWDPDHETIYILKSLPWDKKKKVFWHELRHAVTDLEYWGE